MHLENGNDFAVEVPDGERLLGVVQKVVKEVWFRVQGLVEPPSSQVTVETRPIRKRSQTAPCTKPG
jgi:hypothetical protein